MQPSYDELRHSVGVHFTLDSPPLHFERALHSVNQVFHHVLEQKWMYFVH